MYFFKLIRICNMQRGFNRFMDQCPFKTITGSFIVKNVFAASYIL